MRTIAALGFAVIIGIAGLFPASAQKKTADRPNHENISTIDAWTIKESSAPTDQGSQVTATLNAVGIDAIMSLRCESNRPKALFFLPSRSRQYVAVILHFKGIETMLYRSPDGQSFYAGSAEQFIRGLPDKGNIVIMAVASTGRATSGEFKLGDFSVIRQKIAQACKLAF
jgi:hypothetical protein